MNIDGMRVEQVDEFKYLGVYFTEKGQSDRDIQEKLKMGRRTMERIKKVWKGRQLSF